MIELPPLSGSTTPTVLFSLPGFLGHPSDWKGILPSSSELWKHVPLHYYDIRLSPPSSGLRSWADSFNRMIASRLHHEGPRILLGYSLGGRLALHALCRQPQLWSGAILISTHPGLPSEECAVRIHSDEVWAERFEHEPLEQVLQAWNSQALFDSAPFPAPRPSDGYDRALLAATLRGWSLGRQQELTPLLATLPMPILWIVGEKDLRYSAIAERITLSHTLSHVVVVSGAGHRVPWQQPDTFNTLITNFCHNLQLEPSYR